MRLRYKNKKMQVQAKSQDIEKIKEIKDIQQAVAMGRKRKLTRVISLKDGRDAERKIIKTKNRDTLWNNNNVENQTAIVTNPRAIVKDQFKNNINNNNN